MKTEKCEEMMNRWLSGERSDVVLRHLCECASCRELAELSRLTAESAEPLQVPEHLDRAVLAHAAAKTRTRTLSFTFLMRHALIPAAAAVVVCVGLTFAFRAPSVSTGGKPAVAAVRSQKFASYDFDSADSELLLISSRIQDASAKLTSTAAYSAWDE